MSPQSRGLFWQEKSLVIDRENVQFPDICIVCNSIAEGETEKVKIRSLKISGGSLITVESKSLELNFPQCAKCKKKGSKKTTIAALMAIGLWIITGVAIYFAAQNERLGPNHPMFVWPCAVAAITAFSGLALVFIGVAFQNSQTKLISQSIGQRFVWVKDFNPKWLAVLPEWRGEIETLPIARTEAGKFQPQGVEKPANWDGIPRAYMHSKCGIVTNVSRDIVDNYLADPYFYIGGDTICAKCGIVRDKDCTFIETGECVNDYMKGLRSKKRITYHLVKWILPFTLALFGSAATFAVPIHPNVRITPAMLALMMFLPILAVSFFLARFPRLWLCKAGVI